MGEGRPQGTEEGQYYITNIQNESSSMVNVDKCSITMIAGLLSNIFHYKDIENIQKNKQKKWATCKVKACSKKSKDTILSLNKKDVPLSIDGQIKWKVSLYKRGSIGVINRVPKGQNEEDIKTCLEGKDIKVENVRK